MPHVHLFVSCLVCKELLPRCLFPISLLESLESFSIWWIVFDTRERSRPFASSQPTSHLWFEGAKSCNSSRPNAMTFVNVDSLCRLQCLGDIYVECLCGCHQVALREIVSFITAQSNDVVLVTFPCERCNIWSFMAAFDEEALAFSFASRSFPVTTVSRPLQGTFGSRTPRLNKPSNPKTQLV